MSVTKRDLKPKLSGKISEDVTPKDNNKTLPRFNPSSIDVNESL
jgi:hypothetical protein